MQEGERTAGLLAGPPLAKPFFLDIRAVVPVLGNGQLIGDGAGIAVFLIVQLEMNWVAAPLGDQLVISAPVVCVTGALHIRGEAVGNKAERVRKSALSVSAWPDDGSHIAQFASGLVTVQLAHLDILERTVILNGDSKDFAHLASLLQRGLNSI